MKNVTLTLPEDVAERDRVLADKQGKSLSQFVADMLERNVRSPLGQREAIERLLAGPLLKLTDGNGKAPTRDQIYDWSR